MSDRVVLVTGATGCPTGQSFRRLKQMPDGSQVLETAEYQVPVGKYLEITSIEYTVPYYLTWAGHYTQSIDLNIRSRTSSIGTNVAAIKYGNRAVYSMNETNQLDPIGDYVSGGPQTNVLAFPVGPLMGNTARLCLGVNSKFNDFGGNVRVRGRLIASGELTGGVLPATN